MMYSLLNRVALAGATAGLTIATVLTVAHTNKTPLPCGLSSGCETVAQDPSSSFHGIPVSAFGIAAYIVLMICAILRIRGVALRPSSLLGLLVSLIGTGASAFLTYYSVTKIHATCQWCIGSAIMMVVSLVAYLATPKASEGVPETGKPITSVPWALLPVAIISTYAIFGHVTKEMPVDLSSVKLSSASLAVLERSSHALGGKTAPVTIVEFADLMCPACREMHQRLILFMARNTGKVRLLYHPFPLTHFEGHEDSEYAATLAEQLDGKDFWNFVSAVYGLSEKPTRATLDKLFATQPGKRAMDAGAAAKQVKADIRIGEGYGVKLTPTYILFINGHPESVASSINLKEVIKEPKYYRIFASKPKPKKPAN